MTNDSRPEVKRRQRVLRLGAADRDVPDFKTA